MPVAEGVNVTDIEQFAPGERVLPQVFAEIAKSPALLPVMPALVSDNALPPVLVRVTLWGMVVAPTVWLPKLSAVGLKLAAGPVTPLPERGTPCGEPGALSTNCRLALRVPVAEGVNVTEIEQFAPGASVLPHVLAEIAKSDEFAPLTASLVSANVVALALLVSVTLCGLDVEPTISLPKLTAIGLKLAAVPAAMLPWSPTWPERVLDPVIVI